MPETKRCVFCCMPVNDKNAGRHRAREHVFPAWLLDRLNARRDIIEFSKTEAKCADGRSLQLTDQAAIRQLDFNNFLLGAVCSTCNNGWMSRLENTVKPALGQLAENKPITIENPREIAKWVLKTVFVLSCYLNPTVGRVPDGHGRGLINETARLPKGVAVFRRQAADSRLWFSACLTFHVASSNENGMRSRYNNSYKYIIQIGHAQFLVQYYPSTRVRVGFDPAICTLLDTEAEIFKDTTLNLTASQIQDADFLFMMSTCIYEENAARLGRNDLCYCGSMQKFKHCHGATGSHREQPTPQNWL